MVALNQFNSRIPTQPASQQSTFNNIIYPNDLIRTNSSTNIYMNIAVHQFGTGLSITPQLLAPYATISLPIPIKINDQQTVTWEAASVTSIGAGVLSSILHISGGAAATAVSLLEKFGPAASSAESIISKTVFNPFMVMLFKTQNYKEHVLQWLLAPNNVQESNNLQEIINLLKAAQVPSYGLINSGIPGANILNSSGAILNYPNVVTITFQIPTTNNSQPFLYTFKPCVISSISVDHSAGATPSFFSSGAPALVAVTMQLKEIELWFSNGVGNLL